MDRKDFIKKGLLGTGMFVAWAAVANIMKNDIDEIKPLAPVGFNRLPSLDTPLTGNSVLHKAESRGHSNHGWLDTHQTFSFASCYNPDRMHFGVLRVLNDDIVDGTLLNEKDGMGNWDLTSLEIISQSDASEMLLMEVPMTM